MNPEQYLECEGKSESRHEYFNGEIFLMSGGTLEHCQDLRLWVEHHSRQEPNQWLMTEHTSEDAELDLTSVGVKLSLKSVYEEVLPTQS